jgi:short-subunit dehydrogenase
MSAPRQVTLITGASNGIGADLARVFARHGHDLALVARSRDRLEALADEITASGRPRPLVLAIDLTETNAVPAIAKALDAAGAAPDILVNNAGFGLAGSIADLDPAEQLAIVDLNIRALVEMTLRFLPGIRAAKGKILNVASVVSFFPGGPGLAVYYASKSFVLSFTLALQQEIRGQGVTVTALCPGLTETGFQARAGFDAKMGLSRFAAMSAKPVAEAGYAGLMAGRRVIVPGRINKMTVFFMRFVPTALILPIISHMQHNRRTKY